jgi:hypothetical protein
VTSVFGGLYQETSISIAPPPSSLYFIPLPASFLAWVGGGCHWDVLPDIRAQQIGRIWIEGLGGPSHVDFFVINFSRPDGRVFSDV